jgi:PAS domain S-box-containing protein
VGEAVTFGLRARILLVVSGAMLVALGLVNVVVGRAFQREYTISLESRTLAIATSLELQLQRVLQLGIPLESLIGFDEQCMEVVAVHRDIRAAMVVGRDGTILFHSDAAARGSKIVSAELIGALQEDAPVAVAYAAGGEAYHAAVVPIVVARGEHRASIVVEFPEALVTGKAVRLTASNVGLGLLVLAVATAALAVVLSALVTDPLARLIRSLGELRGGAPDLSRRVGVPGSGDIARLAQAFNGLMDDLQRATVSKAELDAEKERLAVTLRSIGDGVITTDIDGKVVLMNRVAEQLTGWTHEHAASRKLHDVLHITDEGARASGGDPARAVLETGALPPLASDSTLLSRDGRQCSITYSGAPIRSHDGSIVGVVFVLRDVTDKKRFEAELLRAQKLESVGILAGGIAHDFNNILAALLGNISVAREAPPDDVAEILADAESAARRAKDLTQQLLTFSRGGAPIKTLTSLGDVIEESAQFVLRGAKSRAEFSIAEDLWPAAVDASQISQVIHNVVLNADQAMPNGGVVRIWAENVEVHAGQPLPLRPGKYACIAIQDSGVGLSPEQMGKIFDPYFTTKPKGSGLGLTSSYSIVKKHDGHIAVESQVGRGTTFRIHLPASEADRGVRAPRSPAAAPRGGKGRVLVMDDEEPVRKTASRMLRLLGYETELARDGDEALALYAEAREQRRPFDAVIMDLTIPGGMGGREALKRLLAVDPEARVIVSSGYSNDPVMAECAAHGFRCVMTKPYGIEQLGSALAEAIDPQHTLAATA